jgi:glycosyltransferase involved in cell wall biosynthesis
MKRKIVILSAFATPFRSGAEAMVEEVPPFLKDTFDFTIVTARLRGDLSKDDVINGIPVKRIGVGRPIDKWFFPFLAPFAARSLQPDILHAVLESFAGLALMFCRFTVPSAKRVLTLQSTNLKLFTSSLRHAAPGTYAAILFTAFMRIPKVIGRMVFLKPIHSAAHRITAISVARSQEAQRFHKDILLIPNGIPYAALRDAANTIIKRPKSILFVGRLEPMKGVDTLLRAFATISGQGSDVGLRIVGDGSQRQRLEALAPELGIADRVIFAGKVSPEDIAREYASAEIFCGLSRSEALGNVFLEAQAAGCAVVATNVGGIPDIVKDGETGMLVAPDKPEEAAEALSRLLSDEAMRHRLSNAAVEHAKAYDWQGIAEQYRGIYSGLLALSH